MDDARKRLFDSILVWKFDRFARSTKHLILALEEFRHLGIDFLSFTESFDTSTPMVEAMFTIISAMAKLERDLISERVKCGLEYARKKGKKIGRPCAVIDTHRLFELYEQGLSYRDIANKLKVSKSKVAQIILERKNAKNEDNRELSNLESGVQKGLAKFDI